MDERRQGLIDDQVGAEMAAKWDEDSMTVSNLGALVRLVREAREFVMAYDEEWGPGEQEAVAWLSEARALVGEEEKHE